MRYFNLFSNILITKGAGRILISDLQRNISDLYPLELYDMIEALKNKSIENISEDYDIESKQIIQEYIDLLLEKEYGFISNGDWDTNFPPISYEYSDSSPISNLFIETNSTFVLNKIKHSIEKLSVKHLVIYYTTNLSLHEFLDIDNLFSGSQLENIEIYSPFHADINQTLIKKLSNSTLRIYSLIFYNCPQIPFKTKEIFRFNINFSHENLKISACGKVDLKYFNTNLPKILEAINHNSCLHKKIGIDIDGNIKNCPLMPEVFANINNSSLEEALAKLGFKKYWNLTKDNIEVCKDCEFRFVCTDCRAYTERSHSNKEGFDISKPLKCGYNPYTRIWEKWSTNPLKQKAIQYYGMENLL